MNLLKIYIGRYGRYMPTFALLLLFFTSSFPTRLVDGPMIQYLNSQIAICHKYWWSSLLLVQTYVNMDAMVSHCFYFPRLSKMTSILNMSTVFGSYMVFDYRFSPIFVKSTLRIFVVETETESLLDFRSDHFVDSCWYFFCSFLVSEKK